MSILNLNHIQKLESLENIMIKVYSNICQQSNTFYYLQNKFNNQYLIQLEKSVTQAYTKTHCTLKIQQKQISELVNVIQQYFDSLKNEVLNQQRKKQNNFKIDAEVLIKALTTRKETYTIYLDNLFKNKSQFKLSFKIRIYKTLLYVLIFQLFFNY
ncbi:unnamed protein product [Paramecium primaurelia]|uniref:Uncharacterized protein n=1 Tax=Paramecium primaurelia TaxID=5886 RepID=A0A8S1KHX2_PARPR|nr:unnamed protein product [Paramecium primaurelia]